MCAAAFHKPRIDFERAFDRSIYVAGQRNRLDAGFEVGFSEQDENADQAVGSVFQDRDPKPAYIPTSERLAKIELLPIFIYA